MSILFERVTGHHEIDQIPLHISLVLPAASLVGTDPTPGQIAGSVVPAEIARELALRGTSQQTAAVHRLFTDPCTGTVQSIDSRSRTFDGALREFILTRDQVCRTPYCEAPIRHIAHVQPHAKGGPTTALNGQGLCERCNYAKEAPGWKHVSTAPGAGMTHAVTITTPTGHTYPSKAPPILDKPSLACSRPQPSRIEQAIEELLVSTLLSTA